VDLVYWACVPFRRQRTIDQEVLDRLPQKRVAIITAAWREEDVIDRMVLYNAGTIDYDAYDVFIGTYPNDPATQAKVDAVCAALPNVYKAVTSHPGPTNKADNLNHVLAEVMRHEARVGQRYDFVVMHDPEDVHHPLELKVYNHQFERLDVQMVQTPIYPIETPAREFTAGTYMDEFAEVHTKDLHVREWIGGFVPSAGVATAIRRDALDRMAAQPGGRMFSTHSLTEDYDLGLKLALSGLRTVFVRQHVRRRVFDPGSAPGTPPRVVVEVVATRGAFPETFRTSVRQRTRWTLGTVFQAWKTWGWVGNARIRWLLFHDRKAPWAFSIVAAGYLFAAGMLAWELARRNLVTSLPPALPSSPWVTWAFTIGPIFLANRLLQRAVATTRVYGLRAGLLAVPRAPWANVVGMTAAARAAYQFARARRRRETLAWDKTAHTVPRMVATRMRLGELLIQMGALTEAQLVLALREQARGRERVGEVMVRLGFITENELAAALARQQQQSTSTVIARADAAA
jgi:adsorption protein B